jgi:hypothetical protein
MTDYKDFSYWKRRVQRNTLELSSQDFKILFNIIIHRIEELENEVQSLRSKEFTRPRKKLEAED